MTNKVRKSPTASKPGRKTALKLVREDGKSEARLLADNSLTESYHHSYGEGVLGATNKRLLWVSPQKSHSIPLEKIVMFEPFTDGIKIIKDTGKPLLFVFEGPDQASMVRISRVIEELR